MSVVANSALKLADSGVKLTSQILARISPKEHKKLNKLEAERLKIEKYIRDYRSLKPSQRVQSRLEKHIRDLEGVTDAIIVAQRSAEQKTLTMLSQHNASNSTSESE